MKLQIKDAGAWRNVATIPANLTADQHAEVAAAAIQLLRALNQPKVSLRIIDGDRLTQTCSDPYFEWKRA